MNIEIERKFLVKGDYKKSSFKSFRITQGYLNSASGRTVRVRVRDDQGFLTIKGKAAKGGFARFEWEKEIPVEEALELIKLCEPGVIDKTRHLVKAGNHTFEVDEFHGDNEGLVVAEVELGAEDEVFERPSWLGDEVTGDRRYHNSQLISNPFKNWRL